MKLTEYFLKDCESCLPDVKENWVLQSGNHGEPLPHPDPSPENRRGSRQPGSRDSSNWSMCWRNASCGSDSNGARAKAVVSSVRAWSPGMPRERR